MTYLGLWQGGTVSKHIFTALFAAAMVIIRRIIPRNINAAEKAKELELQRSRLEAEKNMVEAELKDSRISIMLSQIQPHFIYNTLGTIERMYLKDPQKAFELVRNFSLYLRGNFSELDSVPSSALPYVTKASRSEPKRQAIPSLLAESTTARLLEPM